MDNGNIITLCGEDYYCFGSVAVKGETYYALVPAAEYDKEADLQSQVSFYKKTADGDGKETMVCVGGGEEEEVSGHFSL